MNGQKAILSLVETGHLSVDQEGRIWRKTKRTPSGSEIPISPIRAETPLKNGYLGVKTSIKNKQFMGLAHRVVWEVMRGPIHDTMDINHLDGDKTNNHPSNLEMVTRSENHLHAYRTRLRLPAVRPIVQELAPAAKELRKIGLSYAAIAERLGVAQMTAYRAVNYEADS